MCARRPAAKTKKNLNFSTDFYNDLSSPDMLYAVLVRSPYTYGKVNSVGFEKSFKLPENYYLITSDDIPAKKIITTLGIKTDIFCSGEIKYKGEPLALLAGPDKKELQSLLSKIRINLDSRELKKSEYNFKNQYNTLSVSPYDGSDLRQRAEALRQSIKIGNKEHREIIAKRDISLGNIENIFSEGTENQYIVEGKWKNSVAIHEIHETEGCFCYVKGANLYVSAPSNWISHLRTAVSDVTGFDTENIIITRTNLSAKNTNSLWQNGLIASQACVAAVVTGKPVMLSLSRQEQKAYIENASKIEITHKTAVSKDGKIKAMDISIEVDTGSFNPFSAEILDRFVIASSGIYSTENLRIKSKVFTSRNPPSSVNLATIDSQVLFAVENQIQKICEKTVFSPLQLRLNNLLNSKSKTNVNPFNFSLGRVEDCLTAVCRSSDFNRKYAVYKLSEQGRLENNEISPFSPPLRGIGLTCGFEGSGYLGTSFNSKNFSLQVSFMEDGKLIVNAVPPSSSIKEIWGKIITEILGIEKKNIVFDYEKADSKTKNTDIDILPDALIGNISIRTHLLVKCLNSLKKKKPEELPCTVKKSISTTLKSQWNKSTFKGQPFFSTSFGACALEVEFDPTIYREKIKGIYVVIDCGKILSVKAAEAAVKKSISKCLSTLMENEKLKCNNIVVQFAQSEDEPKQLGALIQSILPAAYSSALSQTLVKTVSELPLQTDSLFKLKTTGGSNEDSGNS